MLLRPMYPLYFYGSENWVLDDASLKLLQRFQYMHENLEGKLYLDSTHLSVLLARTKLAHAGSYNFEIRISALHPVFWN